MIFVFFQSDKEKNESEKLIPKDIVISDSPPLSSKELDQLIVKAMDEQYTGKVKDVRITEVINTKNNTFVSFLLNEGTYFGALYATKENEKYLLQNIDIANKDKKEKLNVMQIVVEDKEDTQKNYRIITGMINRKFDSVDITYKSDKNNIIQIDGKQRTFLHVNMDNKDLPKKISGKLNDQEIFLINYSD